MTWCRRFNSAESRICPRERTLAYLSRNGIVESRPSSPHLGRSQRVFLGFLMLSEGVEKQRQIVEGHIVIQLNVEDI
jgi:hypothetical protein